MSDIILAWGGLSRDGVSQEERFVGLESRLETEELTRAAADANLAAEIAGLKTADVALQANVAALQANVAVLQATTVDFEPVYANIAAGDATLQANIAAEATARAAGDASLQSQITDLEQIAIPALAATDAVQQGQIAALTSTVSGNQQDLVERVNVIRAFLHSFSDGDFDKFLPDTVSQNVTKYLTYDVQRVVENDDVFLEIYTTKPNIPGSKYRVQVNGEQPLVYVGSNNEYRLKYLTNGTLTIGKKVSLGVYDELMELNATDLSHTKTVGSRKVGLQQLKDALDGLGSLFNTSKLRISQPSLDTSYAEVTYNGTRLDVTKPLEVQTSLTLRDGVSSALLSFNDATAKVSLNRSLDITGKLKATGGIDLSLTPGKALYSDATGDVKASTLVTQTELEYLNGTTSKVQDQLNARLLKLDGATAVKRVPFVKSDGQLDTDAELKMDTLTNTLEVPRNLSLKTAAPLSIGTSTANDVYFKRNDVTRFTVSDTGCGIGTQTPSGLLHVTGTSGAAAMNLIQNGTGPLIEAKKGADTRFRVANDGSALIDVTSTTTALTVKQSGTGDVIDINDGTLVRLTMKSDGRVGIGTGTPSSTHKLHVVGDTKIDGTLTVSDLKNSQGKRPLIDKIDFYKTPAPNGTYLQLRWYEFNDNTLAVTQAETDKVFLPNEQDYDATRTAATTAAGQAQQAASQAATAAAQAQAATTALNTLQTSLDVVDQVTGTTTTIVGTVGGFFGGLFGGFLSSGGDSGGTDLGQQIDAKISNFWNNTTVMDGMIASLSAGKITGQVTDGQIAGMAASKLTGSITNDQLAGSITSAKIVSLDGSKVVGPGQIATSTLPSRVQILENTLTLTAAAGLEYPPQALTAATTNLSSAPYGAGSYVVTESSQQASAYEEWRAFNKSNTGGTDAWASASSKYTIASNIGSHNTPATTTAGYQGEWLQIQMPVAIILQSFSITSQNQTSTRGTPRDFRLFGSNDGTTWVQLFDKTAETVFGVNETRSFTIAASNITPYNYYRLAVNKTNTTGTTPETYVAIGELRLYAAEYSTVASTHNITAKSFTGSGSGLTGLTAAQIPDLPATKITSGTLATAQIPSLDAAKITSGTLAAAQIPNLPATKITSGTLAAAQIPSLDAAKITSGTLAAAQIPNLDAAKITSGTFLADRIANNSITVEKLASGVITDAGWVKSGTNVSLATAADSVGIGTTTPAAKLDIVASGDGAKVLRLGTERAWYFQQVGTSGSAALRLVSEVASKELQIYNGSSNTYTAKFLTGASPSTSLFGPLSVTGAVSGTSFSGDGSAVTNINGANLQDASIPASKLQAGVIPGQTTNASMLTEGFLSVSRLADNSITGAKIAPGVIPTVPDVGWTKSGSSVTLSTSTDSVGIGTAPAAKLHVSGNVIMEGMQSQRFQTLTAMVANGSTHRSKLTITTSFSGKLILTSSRNADGVTGGCYAEWDIAWIGQGTTTGSPVIIKSIERNTGSQTLTNQWYYNSTATPRAITLQTTRSSSSGTTYYSYHIIGKASDATVVVDANAATGTLLSTATFAIEEDNVGIGNLAPTQKLDVSGSVKATSFIGSGASLTGITASQLPSTGQGLSIQGNFGQWQAHGLYTNMNTTPAYWGWNYCQGSTNAPNSTSSQWYRLNVGLGSEYSLSQYWMELAVPRYNQRNAGSMFTRTMENGTRGAWTQVGSRQLGDFVVDGNVGIGQATPTAKLHMETSNSSATKLLLVEGTNTSYVTTEPNLTWPSGTLNGINQFDVESQNFPVSGQRYGNGSYFVWGAITTAWVESTWYKAFNTGNVSSGAARYWSTPLGGTEYVMYSGGLPVNHPGFTYINGYIGDYFQFGFPSRLLLTAVVLIIPPNDPVRAQYVNCLPRDFKIFGFNNGVWTECFAAVNQTYTLTTQYQTRTYSFFNNTFYEKYAFVCGKIGTGTTQRFQFDGEIKFKGISEDNTFIETDGDSLLLSSYGKIGFGTKAPTARFHFVGDSGQKVNSSETQFLFEHVHKTTRAVTNAMMVSADGDFQCMNNGYFGRPVVCNNSSLFKVIRASNYLEWISDGGALGTNFFWSDIRRKDNVQPTDVSALDLMRQVHFIKFDWKPESKLEGHVRLGVSAQELQALDPALVNELSDGYLSVDHVTLLLYASKSIQELQLKIEEQQRQIDFLMSKLSPS